MVRMHEGWLLGWLLWFRDFTVSPSPACLTRFQAPALIFVPFGPGRFSRLFPAFPLLPMNTQQPPEHLPGIDAETGGDGDAQQDLYSMTRWNIGCRVAAPPSPLSSAG